MLLGLFELLLVRRLSRDLMNRQHGEVNSRIKGDSVPVGNIVLVDLLSKLMPEFKEFL